MKNSLSALAVILLVGCSNVPKAYCDQNAADSSEWKHVDPPVNAYEILKSGEAPENEMYFWYENGDSRLRACSYSSSRFAGPKCGSVIFEFQKAEGKWSGGIVNIYVCHL
jgi:hypothetical protein